MSEDPIRDAEDHHHTKEGAHLEDVVTYILDFWSGECPECLTELPKIRDSFPQERNEKLLTEHLEANNSECFESALDSEQYYD